MSCINCRRSQLAISVLLLLLFSLYVLFGEVGVHLLYSWLWAWPRGSAHPPHVTLDTVSSAERPNRIEIIRSNPLSSSHHREKEKEEREKEREKERERESTKILVIADPHIQCTLDKYEPWLFRWDSDTYTKRSFKLLMTGMTPNIVVAVGDVFAEGYKASQQQWEDYLQCLRDVLGVPTNVKMIVLPGDNDIGGEGADEMHKYINKRYIAEFGPFNEVIRTNGFTLIKLNTVTYIHGQPYSIEEAQVRNEVTMFLKEVAENTSRGLLKRPIIVFSHVPVLHLPSHISKLILKSLAPDYIFSGHIHHQLHTTRLYPLPSGGGGEKDVTEFTIPTCSYRMGEAHMGVGAIYIDRHGNLGYRVLWLPPRYPILISYILISLILIILLISRNFGRIISVVIYCIKCVRWLLFIPPRYLYFN